MKKEAQVIALQPNNEVQLIVKRDSACGDCASCGGCSAGQIRLCVSNTLQAKVGDCVIVETASQMILAIAAAVYLLPLLLFFAGYALGAVTELSSLLLGGVGFVAAIFAVVLLNRKISAKIGYHMIGFVEEL